MTTSSTAALIASVIARKSSISWLGVPAGVRAWMWIIAPPSSTARRASAAYSSGVYGIAGHWSRLATAPEIEQVRITGSSRLIPATLPDRPACRGATAGITGHPVQQGKDRSMIGTLIAAIIIGIIAGYLGRALLPGDDSMGFVQTVIVGIVGALIGWALFTFVLGIGDKDKFDLGGIIGAIIGTMIVLLILRAVRGNGTR